MSKIYILKYNNYHNRLLKSETTIAAYKTAAGAGNWVSFSGINFDKKDGIDTTQTINFTTRTDFEGNYCIVTDDNDNILSRWFILENLWNRQSQLILTLKRDVKIDFFDDYKNAPFYAEKGYISGSSDPLKYVSEGQSFNKILQYRHNLLDNLLDNKRYIVGFVDKTWKGGSVYKGAVYDTWEDFPLYKFRNSLIFTSPKYGIRASVLKDSALSPGTGTQFFRLSAFSDGSTPIIDAGSVSAGTQLFFNNNTINGTLAQSLAEDWLTPGAVNDDIQIRTDTKEAFDVVDKDVILQNWANGDKFFIGNVEYQLNLSQASIANFYIVNSDDYYNDNLRDSFIQYGSGNWVNDSTRNYSAQAFTYGRKWNMTFTATGQIVEEVDLFGPRNHTGQPYDIFYMEDEPAAREFVSYFASQYAGGKVLYDLQLVPYHPKTNFTNRVEYASGKYLYWTDQDYRTGSLSNNAISYADNEAFKVGSNCDMCRLVSPDGGTYWEFNPAQMGGITENSLKFEITFIPFATYIKVFPTFGGIYGSVNLTDYGAGHMNETRALVCVDDFSLAYSTNNWETFKLQNSAYEKAHDRTMKNMSITQTAERINEIVVGIANAAGTTLMGSMLGPSAAIAGGVGSLAAGAGSFIGNEIMRKEEKSYAEDMFNYQLENIQAQAQPLAKSNSVVIGNAWFPYIEYYTATDAEKNIFKDRLEQHGWSLGIVTTFDTMKTRASGNNFTKFIKGTIIRMNIDDDAHVAAVISEELKKGVYIP